MEELKVDFRKLNTDDDRKSYYAEVKSIRPSKINYDESNTKPNDRPTNLKVKFEQCLKEARKRQEIKNEWMKKIMISTDLSLKDHDSSIKRLEQKVNHLAQLISTQNPKHTREPKTETFGEKVKRCIIEENREPTSTHKLKQQLRKVVSHEIKELSAHCSPTLQNKLPPKETDPGGPTCLCRFVALKLKIKSTPIIIPNISKIINYQYYSLSLEEFAEILGVLCEGACVFTDKWALYELANGLPEDGPYQTSLPSLDDIITLVSVDREGPVTRVRHKKEIDVLEYQVLTRKIKPSLKPLEEIIRENVFCLGGNRDHVPACLCFMLYCVAHSKKFNLAYYMAKRMEWVTKQARANLRRDSSGMREGRIFTSSSSAFDQPSLSYLNDDDNDGNDEGTLRASTHSLISYVNSLTDQVPQVF
ncbi:hypothetical protein Tco_0580357 [Tanacetum coccineum]